MHALNVPSDLQRITHIKFIYGHIRKKNRIFVVIAVSDLAAQENCWSIREFIPAIVHINVILVRHVLSIAVILKDIQKFMFNLFKIRNNKNHINI